MNCTIQPATNLVQNVKFLLPTNPTSKKPVTKRKATATTAPIHTPTTHDAVSAQPALAPATPPTKDTVAALNANHVLTLQRIDYSLVLVFSL